MTRLKAFAFLMGCSGIFFACAKSDEKSHDKRSSADEQQLQAELEDIKQRHAELLRRKDELENERNSTDERLRLAMAELEALRADPNATERIRAKEQEIAALATQLQIHADQLRVLEAARTDLSSALDNVLKPFQGLWQIQTKKKLANGNACRVFLDITGTAYQKAVICDDGELKASYEHGMISHLDEAYDGEATSLSARFSGRILTTTPQAFTCQPDTPGTYLARSKSIEWKAATKDFLYLVTNSEALPGLYADDHSRDAANCEQIRARPGRVGLEQAEHACRIFDLHTKANPSSEETAALQSIPLGCFTAFGEVVAWHEAPLITAADHDHGNGSSN